VLHPLRLREIAEIARGVDARDLTPERGLESMATFERRPAKAIRNRAADASDWRR
jgi:hypothetical protein